MTVIKLKSSLKNNIPRQICHGYYVAIWLQLARSEFFKTLKIYQYLLSEFES